MKLRSSTPDKTPATFRSAKNSVTESPGLEDFNSGTTELDGEVESELTMSNLSMIQSGELLIVTVLVESGVDAVSISARLDATRRVLAATVELVGNCPALVVFQAGWLDSKSHPAIKVLHQYEPELRRMLRENGLDRLVIAFGVDGRNGRDQLAAVLSSSGFKVVARKFHPTREEMRWEEPLLLAERWDAGESGYSRIVEILGHKIFIAVCYDTFGIPQFQLPRPDVDAVVCHLHLFGPRKSNYVSGDSYFARLGLAGASRQWNVPVFAAAQFLHRSIPVRWPSGVLCATDTGHARRLTYEDISLTSIREPIRIRIREGIAELRFFKLP
jgi:predicted amidohydrolase